MSDGIILDSNDTSIDVVMTANSKVHIRLRQRNGRKSVTIIENLPQHTLQSLLVKMRKKFHCNGSIKKTDLGDTIQLFGDQRMVAKQMLIDDNIVDAVNISIHGY